MQSKLAIAIPTYNERVNVGPLIGQLRKNFPFARIVVVDDNSPDGTADAVREICKSTPNVELIWRPQKNGLASAYFEAFRKLLADPDIDHIVTMDADYSHDPNELKKLLQFETDYDLVIGSRYAPGGQTRQWNVWRRGLSRFGNLYASAILGKGIRDWTAGFVVYSRPLLESLLQHGVRSQGYGFQIEMKYFGYRNRVRIKEVPITFIDRSQGQSKLGKGSIKEGIMIPWFLRLSGAEVMRANEPRPIRPSHGPDGTTL